MNASKQSRDRLFSKHGQDEDNYPVQQKLLDPGPHCIKKMRFPKSQLAYRAFAGAGYEFDFTRNPDKRSSLPFFKEYFAGGPHSMRAWSLRRLGPGSSVKEFNGGAAHQTVMVISSWKATSKPVPAWQSVWLPENVPYNADHYKKPQTVTRLPSNRLA